MPPNPALEPTAASELRALTGPPSLRFSAAAQREHSAHGAPTSGAPGSDIRDLPGQVEVCSTAFVDSVRLKGFADSVCVYRVQKTHRTRVIANEYIVVTDLGGFARIVEAASLTTVERMLEALFGLTNRVAAEFSGTVRFSAGD